MPQYTNLKATAKRLITKFGESCTIRLSTKGVNPDPLKAHQGAVDVIQDHPDISVVFLPDTYDARQTVLPLKDKEIPTGSTLGYVGDFPHQIDQKTTIIRGSRTYRVATAVNYQPNDESSILWILRLS